MNIQPAIGWLRANEGLVLPHNGIPGVTGFLGQSGVSTTFDEATWNAYVWNPPFDLPFDPNASPKPTWQELQDADAASAVSGWRRWLLRELRSHCEKLICDTVFGANGLTHEMQIRNRLTVSGRAEDQAKLDRMSQHRDQMRARYHEIKAYITSVPLTQAGRTKADAWSRNTDDLTPLFTSASWTAPSETEPFEAFDMIPDYEDVAPDGPPPAELRLKYVTQDNLTYRFVLVSTAPATVTVTAIKADGQPFSEDLDDFIFERAGKRELTLTLSRAGGLTVTATASPYGAPISAILRVPAPGG